MQRLLLFEQEHANKMHAFSLFQSYQNHGNLRAEEIKLSRVAKRKHGALWTGSTKL